LHGRRGCAAEPSGWVVCCQPYPRQECHMNADAITPLRHRRIEDVNVNARKLSASTNMAPPRAASSMAVSRQAGAIGSSLRPSRQRSISANNIERAALEAEGFRTRTACAARGSTGTTRKRRLLRASGKRSRGFRNWYRPRRTFATPPVAIATRTRSAMRGGTCKQVQSGVLHNLTIGNATGAADHAKLPTTNETERIAVMTMQG